MRRVAAGAALALGVPAPAAAHDAFGDLGPFYGSLLHPAADPAQGLLVAAAAVLLARQPLTTVRPAYAAFVLTAGLGALLPFGALGPQASALAAVALGLAAVLATRLAPILATILAAAAGAAAGLAAEIAPGLRDGALSLIGGALGIALAALLVWVLIDALQRHLTPVAGAVAAAWIAAVGIMTTALTP
jgi:urease accessory protein